MAPTNEPPTIVEKQRYDPGRMQSASTRQLERYRATDRPLEKKAEQVQEQQES